MPQIYRPFAAALWMSGSILSFSVMAVAGRALAPFLDTFEIMLWRSLIGLALVLSFGAALGRLGGIRSNRLGTHLLRNLFHFTGQNLWFMSLTLIPLATVFALEFTAPIWVMLLSPLLLAERMTRVRWLAAGAGFLGVLIVVRPDLGQPSVGVALAAGSAIGFAGSAILTKRLTRHEGVISILFWLTAMQTVLAAVAAGHDGRVTLPDAATLPWLAMVGVTGVLAHLCLTRALALAPATVVMPMDFLRLPVIAAVGALAYGEAITPALALGSALILAANWINIRFANRQVPPQPNVISL